jgi:hypothetical protein
MPVQGLSQPQWATRTAIKRKVGSVKSEWFFEDGADPRRPKKVVDRQAGGDVLPRSSGEAEKGWLAGGKRICLGKTVPGCSLVSRQDLVQI